MVTITSLLLFYTVIVYGYSRTSSNGHFPVSNSAFLTSNRRSVYFVVGAGALFSVRASAVKGNWVLNISGSSASHMNAF